MAHYDTVTIDDVSRELRFTTFCNGFLLRLHTTNKQGSQELPSLPLRLDLAFISAPLHLITCRFSLPGVSLVFSLSWTTEIPQLDLRSIASSGKGLHLHLFPATCQITREGGGYASSAHMEAFDSIAFGGLNICKRPPHLSNIWKSFFSRHFTLVGFHLVPPPSSIDANYFGRHGTLAFVAITLLPSEPRQDERNTDISSSAALHFRSGPCVVQRSSRLRAYCKEQAFTPTRKPQQHFLDFRSCDGGGASCNKTGTKGDGYIWLDLKGRICTC